MYRRLSSLGFILRVGVVSALLTACSITPPLPPELTQCMTRQDRFVASEDGTVLDTCTQLTWMAQDFRNITGESPVGRQYAWAWADRVNDERYANYNDWRVPSPMEYKTLYSRENPQQSYRGRAIYYPAVFARGGGEWYWTNRVWEWGDPPNHVHHVLIFNYENGSTMPRYVKEHKSRGEFPDEVSGSVRLVRGPVFETSR